MNKDLETAKLLVDAVKVMVPVLTGILTVFTAGIGKLWDKRSMPLIRFDYKWLLVISLFAILSFGCWALTLAGAIVSTSGRSGLTIPFSGNEALIAARFSMGVGYWMFLFTLFSCGYYFLKLQISERANKPIQPTANASAD